MKIDDLNKLAESLNWQLDGASPFDGQRFANIPPYSYGCDHVRKYIWMPIDHGGQYDRNFIAFVYDDDSVGVRELVRFDQAENI
jgi:hypothetical protein